MLKKYINKFLNNKTDFEKDIQLKTLNDQFYYLLNAERSLLNHVIIENIRYYFKHKKIYLLKVLMIFLLNISLFCGIIALIFYGLEYFNVIEIRKPEIVVDYKTAYTPDWDTINQNKLINDGYNIIIFYPPNPKKDWKKFKEEIHKIESNFNSPYIVKNGEYWGKYQLGNDARNLVGLKNVTWKEFSTNPEMQEGAFLTWVRLTKKQLYKYDLYKYMGKFMRGFQITESGLIAMVHNCGIGGAQVFLKSNGQQLPKDGNPILFGKVGGYNLNLD